MSDSLTPCSCQTSLSSIISWSLLKIMSIESVMPPNHLILCHPLLLLPSVFLSIRVFSNELALCIKWPKDCNCSFIISPCNEYSGFNSFRIDWFDLFAVQGTLKSPNTTVGTTVSNTTVQKHHFFSAQPSLWSSSHIQT